MADLEELYREIILDHYRSPRNRGELESPPALRAEGFNPLCGDEVVVTVAVDDGRLTDIKIAGSGCSISQSSASLMSAAVKGKDLDEVRQVIERFKSMMSIHEASLPDVGDGGADAARARREAEAASGAETLAGEPEEIDVAKMGELAALQGVVKFPMRIKCATLSWNTLAQGLRQSEAADPPEGHGG